MGIPLLNKYIREHSDSVNQTTIDAIKGLTIAIDINNYLYRIVNINHGDIIENTELFCCLLKEYEVTPLFVFDGKTPEYKKPLIEKRKQKMVALRNKLDILQKIQASNTTVSHNDNLTNTIECLKDRTKKVSYKQINAVKAFLIKEGYTVLTSANEKEADDICVSLINNDAVDAIMSDDMDFVGKCCKLVVRVFDQNKKTCCLYHNESILKDLKMTKESFCKMCETQNYV